MDKLIEELEEKVFKVNFKAWYFKDLINEFIELAKKAKLGDNFDELMFKNGKLIGYFWALSDTQIISNELREDLIDLCSDIVSQSIFQE